MGRCVNTASACTNFTQRWRDPVPRDQLFRNRSGGFGGFACEETPLTKNVWKETSGASRHELRSLSTKNPRRTIGGGSNLQMQIGRSSRLSLSRRSLEKTSGAEILIHEEPDENQWWRIDSLDADGGSSRASLSRRSLEKPVRNRLGGSAPHASRWKSSGSSLRRGSLARSSGPTITTI